MKKKIVSFTLVFAILITTIISFGGCASKQNAIIGKWEQSEEDRTNPDSIEFWKGEGAWSNIGNDKIFTWSYDKKSKIYTISYNIYGTIVRYYFMISEDSESIIETDRQGKDDGDYPYYKVKQ